MLPGPVIVNKCPRCSGLVKQRTLASGNTLGAKRWTDGEFRARMLPRTPSLIRCGHCHQVSWRRDFEEVDSYDSYLGFLAFSEKEEDKRRMEEAELKQTQYADLPYYEEPSGDEITDFVSQGMSSSDEELYARVRAWQRWNDGRRDDDSYKPLTLDEQQNLRRVVELLEASGGQELILAEAYRELGELHRAKDLLERGVIPGDHQSVVQFIIELIERGDSQVCLIADDDEREWRMLRRLKSRENPEPALPPYAEDGPPVFEIGSRDWWFKPVEMLVHNWALIENNPNGTATVYFFHDQGLAKNADPRYKYSQLKGRCAVIDSLDFEDDALAECELEFNGFQQLSKRPGPWDGSEPFGTFYDARLSEDGLYSRLGFWKSLN